MSKPVVTDMKFKAVMMTPEWAKELLRNNHPNNRKTKDRRISTYATEMASGLWRLTHQAIAVDEDGKLVDGQNRLHAVVLADCEVPMVVANNVPRRAMGAVDCGANRNVNDAARIAGKPLPHSSYPGVARCMMRGLAPKTLSWSNQQVLYFIEEHREALDFAFTEMGRNVRFISPAGVRAAVARAWYQRNSRTRLREFCEAIYTGLIGSVKEDVAVVRLRNWLLLGKEQTKKASTVDVYAKAEYALKAFLDREEIASVRSAKEELFPIPTKGDLEIISVEHEPAPEEAA